MKTIEEHNKELEQTWSGKAKTYSSSLAKHNMPVMAFVSNLSKVPFNKTILEVGCGNGEGTKYLTLQAPSHCVIYSLDFSEPMLDLANETFKNFTNFNLNKDNSFERLTKESIKQKLTVKNEIQKTTSGTHVKFIPGDCENLPFADEQFETYVSCLCLHLTNDYHQALKEAYRVLQKGGHFAMALWGKRELTNFRLIEDVCDKYGLNIKCFRNYRMSEDKELISFCEGLGFSKVRVSYSNLIRDVAEDEFEFYEKFFDKDLKNQIEEIGKKDPAKAKEIDDAIKAKLHEFFAIEKKVPEQNVMYLYGRK